jgi:tetratricopeptide (TPR) repeat protein
MTAKNKNLRSPTESRLAGCRYQAIENGYMSVRFGWLSLYICVLLFVSFVCNITMGEFDSDEIDPTALLAIDSDQQEPGLYDIQIPSHAEVLASIKNYPIAYSLLSPGAITTNFAAEVNLPQSIPSPVGTSSGKLGRQLMDSRISSLSQDHDKNKTDELKQMIEQVRSVKLEPRQQAQQQTSVTPVENTTPAVTVEQPSQPSRLLQKSAGGEQIQPSVSSTSNETLKLVENQLKDPNLISNPYELAEILFKSGRQVQAGICYKQALKVLPADDPNVATERAWILFQIGNCLKDEDPNTARESYAELIRTHSSSPWAEIAKARYGIIEWYQQDNPGELIQQLNKPNPR